MARIDETWHRLRDWTLGQPSSERLAAHVLRAEGYTGIDPSHPLGGRDGGRDAVADKDGRRWVMAAYFPQGQVSFTKIKNKVRGDYAGVASNDADGVVFVTNQQLTLDHRKQLVNAVDGPLELIHLERLTHILDTPAMAAVRAQYLDIAVGGDGLNATARCDELLRASRARCVARWMAAGLNRPKAEELADDPGVGAPPGHLPPGPDDPVVIWTAELGSGKSIAAERVHQADVQATRSDLEAPIGVFLRATETTEGLLRAVTGEAREVGEPRVRGAHVVVDGVDEVGLEAAERLLEEARVLAGTWPATTVLLISRRSRSCSAPRSTARWLRSARPSSVAASNWPRVVMSRRAGCTA